MVTVKAITSGESRAIKARKCKEDTRIVNSESDKSSEEEPFSDDADDSSWIKSYKYEKSVVDQVWLIRTKRLLAMSKSVIMLLTWLNNIRIDMTAV